MSTINNFRDFLTINAKPSSVKVIIYTQVVSPRLIYTCKFIFNHVLNSNFELTNDVNRFTSEEGFRINYSSQFIDRCFQVIPATLIFESTINENKPQPFWDSDRLYFYINQNKEGNLLFDVFACVFYFTSRYEEWQNHEDDKHERFELKSSLLYQNNKHLTPMVDVWIHDFKLALQKYYPTLKFPAKGLQAVSTIDVDNLYAYKAKGFIRLLGASVKDILKRDFYNLALRFKVVLGIKKDPFDIYEEISAFCKQNQLPLIYFFLFRSGTTYDRTVNPKSSAFKKVFKLIDKGSAYFGLHPSYNSAYKPGHLANEIQNLEETSGKKITFSRQHYLRFNIRTTPNLLIQNGIQTDFSMGFASGPGFRAGTSHPFFYYDFNTETEAELLFVPFCAMDGAYAIYNKQSTEAALTSLLNLATEVKRVGGYFITVFHERTFFDHLYPGFGTLYKKMYLHVKALSQDKI